MPVSVVVLITHGKRLQIIEVSVYANNLYQPKGSDCSKHFASDAFFSLLVALYDVKERRYP